MFIQITRLFKNKWHGTPESLIAFSSLSTTATTMFEGLVDLHVFIVKHMFLLVGVLLQSDKTKALVNILRFLLLSFMPHMKWQNSLPSSKPISSSDAACFWCSFVSVVNPTLVIKTPILSDRICQRFFLNDQKLWLASCHEILLSSLYKNSIFFSSITCFP